MEEKKEEAKQEEVKQEQPKPQEAAVKEEAPKEEKKTEKPVAEEKAAVTETPTDGKPKKNKKINNMNLADVEEKLKISREKMGTYGNAQYVQELLKKREVLMGNQEPVSEPI